MDRVKKVDLYENGTIAIVEAVSPELGNRVQRVRVQLPGSSQVSGHDRLDVKPDKGRRQSVQGCINDQVLPCTGKSVQEVADRGVGLMC